MRELEETFFGTLFGAVEIAALFFPVSFLFHFVSLKSEEWAVLIPVVASFATCFAVASISRKQSIAKILLSLPLGLCFESYMIDIGFFVRGYNFWIPGFGYPTDFAGLVLVFQLEMMLGLEIFAFFLGLCALSPCRTDDNSHRVIWFMKKGICPGVCILIYLAVMIADAVFPPEYTFSRSILGG